MNKDTLEKSWNCLKEQVKQRWAKLTEEDIRQISGKRNKLTGIIQKRYGCNKEQATKELLAWEKEVGCQNCQKEDCCEPSCYSKECCKTDCCQTDCCETECCQPECCQPECRRKGCCQPDCS